MRIGLLLIILSCGLIAGCATGMQGSARRACYDAGLTPGTPEFENCWKRIRDQQFADEMPAIFIGVMAGTPAPAAPVVPADAIIDRPPLSNRNPLRLPPPPGLRLAPDGTYVGGTGPIRMCPDGSYIAGLECNLTPNGVYVAGPPRQTPIGTYVGGSGKIIRCPNGDYVAGSRCVLAPDGTYVGAD